MIYQYLFGVNHNIFTKDLKTGLIAGIYAPMFIAALLTIAKKSGFQMSINKCIVYNNVEYDILKNVFQP